MVVGKRLISYPHVKLDKGVFGVPDKKFAIGF